MSGDVITDELFNDGWHEVLKAQKQRELTKTERKKLVRACQNVLGSESGLALLYNIINQTGVFMTSFTGNSTTFFLEGRRSIGLYLYQLLVEADPAALHKLIEFRRKELSAKDGNQ